ncbi:hypothetical protein DA2_1589 [Desulfovibrio sp. A2]|nr:hypothetical protein DA2_1589 [Desulfovibrio sp. A2]
MLWMWRRGRAARSGKAVSGGPGWYGVVWCRVVRIARLPVRRFVVRRGRDDARRVQGLTRVRSRLRPFRGGAGPCTAPRRWAQVRAGVGTPAPCAGIHDALDFFRKSGN